MGAQIDHMDRYGHVAHELGYNALMLAAQYDHQDMAKMLIGAGADTGLLTSTSNENNMHWSNVMVAAWYGDQEVRAPSFASLAPSALQPQTSMVESAVCMRRRRLRSKVPRQGSGNYIVHVAFTISGCVFGKLG